MADSVAGEVVNLDKVLWLVSTSTESEATLEGGAITILAESGIALALVADGGSVSLGSDILGRIAGENGISFRISFSGIILTDAQSEVIEKGSTVFEITMVGGPTSGSNVEGTIVTIAHPYKRGTSPVAYFVDEDGTKVRVPEQTYDPEKEILTLVLEHMSVYEIVDEKQEHSEYGDKMIYLIVGAIAAISLVVCAYYVLKRH